MEAPQAGGEGGLTPESAEAAREKNWHSGCTRQFATHSVQSVWSHVAPRVSSPGVGLHAETHGIQVTPEPYVNFEGPYISLPVVSGTGR